MAQEYQMSLLRAKPSETHYSNRVITKVKLSVQLSKGSTLHTPHTHTHTMVEYTHSGCSYTHKHRCRHIIIHTTRGKTVTTICWSRYESTYPMTTAASACTSYWGYVWTRGQVDPITLNLYTQYTHTSYTQVNTCTTNILWDHSS